MQVRRKEEKRELKGNEREKPIEREKERNLMKEG